MIGGSPLLTQDLTVQNSGLTIHLALSNDDRYCSQLYTSSSFFSNVIPYLLLFPELEKEKEEQNQQQQQQDFLSNEIQESHNNNEKKEEKEKEKEKEETFDNKNEISQNYSVTSNNIKVQKQLAAEQAISSLMKASSYSTENRMAIALSKPLFTNNIYEKNKNNKANNEEKEEEEEKEKEKEKEYFGLHIIVNMLERIVCSYDKLCDEMSVSNEIVNTHQKHNVQYIEEAIEIIQQNVIHVIANLAREDQLLSPLSSAMSALITTLQQRRIKDTPLSTSITSFTLLAISRLSIHEPIRQKIGFDNNNDNNVIKVLIQFVEEHHRHSFLQQLALHVFLSLLVNVNNKKIFLDNDGVFMILNLLSNPSILDKEVLMNTVLLLRDLSYWDAFVDDFFNKEGLNVLIKLLAINNEQALLYIVEAMEHMALFDIPRIQLKQCVGPILGLRQRWNTSIVGIIIERLVHILCLE